MKQKINVLVFPAGEINSIELHDALSTCVNINLFGASSIDRHGEYVFKNYVSGLPLIDSPLFLEKFNEILKTNKIDVVFPTHDSVAKFFSENRELINAKVIVADKKTSAICRDKRKIYEYFKEFDFIPKIYSEIKRFPVFIKPRESQGSKGAKLINSGNELSPNINLNDYVICEYLPGEEYTVDCLTDKNGKLIFVSPRSRKRVLAGVTVSGAIEELTPEIQFIAENINKKMSFLGLWWFQIKKDSQGRWKLLEISTRVAGTMCLTRARGVNLPLLSVYIAMNYDVDVTPNTYKVQVDRTLISRYKIDYEYNTVYMDFDDTIIVNGKVNQYAIWFLFQCKNLNQKVILITKHENEIYDTFKEHGISQELFTKIIHLKIDDNKISYINPHKAIFIDNAYQERAAVARKYSIPVFDVDGIEVLLDWRN